MMLNEFVGSDYFVLLLLFTKVDKLASVSSVAGPVPTELTLLLLAPYTLHKTIDQHLPGVTRA
jgi:hypothetical protein